VYSSWVNVKLVVFFDVTFFEQGSNFCDGDILVGKFNFTDSWAELGKGFLKEWVWWDRFKELKGGKMKFWNVKNKKALSFQLSNTLIFQLFWCLNQEKKELLNNRTSEFLLEITLTEIFLASIELLKVRPANKCKCWMDIKRLIE
jgi:hypothetical protein